VRTTQNTQGVATLRNQTSAPSNQNDGYDESVISALWDDKFQKRNNYTVATTKTVLFQIATEPSSTRTINGRPLG
jgi:hypothetical protein